VAASPSDDPHRVLGVAPGADEQQIRLAYRRAAKSAHPDAGGDPTLFVRLRAALDSLLSGGGSGAGDVSPPGQEDPVARDVGSGSRNALRRELARQWHHLDVLWHRSAGGGHIVGCDGPLMFVASDREHRLEAVDALTGDLHWHAAVTSPLARNVHGPIHEVVVAATADGSVHGFNAASGVTRWEHRMQGPVVGSVVVDGLRRHQCVVVASPGGMQALGADGAVLWSLRLDGVCAGPVPAGDAVVVVTHSGHVVAVDSRTGKSRWWVRHQGVRCAAPVVAGSWVWLADGPDRLLAIDMDTGSARHGVELGEPVLAVSGVPSGLAVRTGANALVHLGRRGRPFFKVHLEVAYADPVWHAGAGLVCTDAHDPQGASGPPGQQECMVVAVADGSLRFIAPASGAQVHHVVAPHSWSGPQLHVWPVTPDVMAIEDASGAIDVVAGRHAP
jgi:hypothetical protein